MDALDAVAVIQSVIVQGGWGPCGASDPVQTRITGMRVSIECRSDAASVEHAYRQHPCTRLESRRLLLYLVGCETTDSSIILTSTPDVRRAFAIAWVTLANRPSIVGDSAFVASLQATPSIADPEDLRRTQIQVEAAIRANRTIDAARLYRDTLRTAPAWAEGHFNLGLLYGELELYPEAITEMRRYLYLAPNAPDARAVQDRIYEWEAAMGPAVQ